MRSFSIASGDLPPDFEVLDGTRRSQAATLVIEPKGSTGGPDNRHLKSDQWLYVLAGKGRATVGGRELELARGTLVLISAGEAHEIRNTGDKPLETLSFFAPPAY